MKLRYSPKFGLMLETHPENMVNPVLEILNPIEKRANEWVYLIPGTDIEIAIEHYHNFDFPLQVSD